METKLNSDEIKNICGFLPIAKSKENFTPIEQRIKERVGKYCVYLDGPGENKSKVLLAVKKETGLSFNEIRNRLNSNGFLLAELGKIL
ncbi:hypothetical protein [Lysinibacillus sp. NPDC059133]|uniref:hypothetical protein n=1 Tax=Lysinibacillus sp. NPDC059133 TaxID=3346737 RepID=UPI0036C439C9